MAPGTRGAAVAAHACYTSERLALIPDATESMGAVPRSVDELTADCMRRRGWGPDRLHQRRQRSTESLEDHLKKFSSAPSRLNHNRSGVAGSDHDRQVVSSPYQATSGLLKQCIRMSLSTPRAHQVALLPRCADEDCCTALARKHAYKVAAFQLLSFLAALTGDSRQLKTTPYR